MSMDASPILLATSDFAQSATRILLRSSSTDRMLYFYPALFQLTAQCDGNDERIDLGYAGSRLLERLLQEPGEVVPREELMSFAWSDRVVGQGSLNQQIYSLRRLFCDEKGREIIQTLPRRGYLFNPQYVVELQWVEPAPAPEIPAVAATPAINASPAATLPTAAAQPTSTPAVPRSRWPAIALFVGTLLIGLGANAWITDKQPALLTRSIHQDDRVVYLLAADAEELDSLQRDSDALLQRILALSSGPLELTLDRHDGYYRLFCQRGAEPSKWLMLHRSQLDLLSTAQLMGCLP